MSQDLQKLIIESAELARELIDDLFAANPSHETFEQVGLLDGFESVVEYIEVGESGCALEHLLYMIHESDISYPRERMLHLHTMAKELGIKNHYSKENQANLSPELVRSIYNPP